MTDNHMVFFAEITFIYGGNDSSEKDVFGSERSSEKIIKSSERSSETTAISSGTGSGIQPQNSWTIQAAKPSMGTSIHRNQAIFFLFLHKVAKASMRFLPYRTTVSLDKC